MCIRTILDASAFRHLCEPSKNSAGGQLRSWIKRRDGVIVYSGGERKYARELRKHSEAYRLMKTYVDNGQAEEIDDQSIQQAMSQIPGRSIRRSDDAHVLALALAGKATLLFSRDLDLLQDFTDRRVIERVGGHQRHCVPHLAPDPKDTKKASYRRKFLETRKCPASSGS